MKEENEEKGEKLPSVLLLVCILFQQQPTCSYVQHYTSAYSKVNLNDPFRGAESRFHCTAAPSHSQFCTQQFPFLRTIIVTIFRHNGAVPSFIRSCTCLAVHNTQTSARVHQSTANYIQHHMEFSLTNINFKSSCCTHTVIIPGNWDDTC